MAEELRDKNGLTESEFLAAYDASKFERPSVTVDIILIYENKVLLIKRGGHPFLGKLALPGGFLEPEEDAYTAAARELFEETGVKAKDLKMLRAVTMPYRDPRTRIVTIPFIAHPQSDPSLAKAGDDAADACWYEYSVIKQDGSLTVELTPENGGEQLKFTVRKYYDKDGKRADPTYEIIGDQPLACDHAELLAMALDI